MNSDSLGSITKFASARGKMDANVEKAERFFLQSVARKLVPEHRVRVCWRHKLPTATNIDIVHLPETGAGHVRGLMRCCSVWVCPVCSGRISEQRRVELSTAIESYRDQYLPVMVTLTIRHHKKRPLSCTLASLISAYRRLVSGRAWQSIKEEYSLVGSVRSTEITYGENGWHPHFHVLLFLELTDEFVGANSFSSVVDGEVKQVLDIDALAASLENQISRRWLHVLAMRGDFASLEHGCVVSTQSGDVAAYIAKYGRLPIDRENWTLSHELTKANVKKASKAGETPFGLLRLAATGDEEAAELFVEYVAATKGRSQLQWSRGLKALLGIDDLSDDDVIALDDSAEYVLLASITAQLWRRIIDSGFAGDVITLASQNDRQGLLAMLAEIAGEQEHWCMSCFAQMEAKMLPSGERVFICPVCDREVIA